MKLKWQSEGKRRNVKPKEQHMDGGRRIIGKDLTEDDTEDRGLSQSKIFSVKDTFCSVEKS